MALKKVLAAVGLVCVITPAALAAIGHKQSEYRYNEVKKAVHQLLGTFGLLEGVGDGGEGKLPPRAGPESARLPFLATSGLWPNLAELGRFDHGLSHGEPGRPFHDDGSVVGKAMAVSAGGRATETRQSERYDGTSYAAKGAPGRRGAHSFGTGGSGGGATGFGGGVNAPSGVPPEKALAMIDEENGIRRDDQGVSTMPVPSSVWMLFGAMLGLGVLGHRRRTR